MNTSLSHNSTNQLPASPAPGSAAKPRPNPDSGGDRATLAAIARRAMVERGLEPDFPPPALQELAAISAPAGATDGVRDLRDRLWASIDNDDSRDLDQLTVAEPLAGGRVRILVAVADVDALVRKGSAIDGHASHNTTSVYTPAAIFSMLPEALSTDLTSLNEDQDRLAVIADMVFAADGSLAACRVGHPTKRRVFDAIGRWRRLIRINVTAGIADQTSLKLPHGGSGHASRYDLLARTEQSLHYEASGDSDGRSRRCDVRFRWRSA